MSKENGFLPGWPPFHQFRKEMADMAGRVVEEKLKPITEDIKTLKSSLVSHISNTKAEFKKTSNKFGHMDTEFKKASNRFDHLDRDIKTLKSSLVSHISNTKAEFKEVSNKLGHLDAGFKKVSNKLSHLDAGFKKASNRLGHLDAGFKKVSNRLSHLDAGFKKASNRFNHLDKDMKQVKTALSNHITDTNKKIDRLGKTVNSKLDTLLKFSGKSHKRVKKEKNQPPKLKAKKN